MPSRLKFIHSNFAGISSAWPRFFPITANEGAPCRLSQPLFASGHKVLGRTQHPILYGRKQIATQKKIEWQKVYY